MTESDRHLSPVVFAEQALPGSQRVSTGVMESQAVEIECSDTRGSGQPRSVVPTMRAAPGSLGTDTLEP